MLLDSKYLVDTRQGTEGNRKHQKNKEQTTNERK